MFGKLRKRMTYANVAMTLALVFAMSGGAWAAGKFVITSTKQIKPSVLKQLQGKVGPAGVPGKDGAPGTNGKDGLNGTNGKDGTPGIEGKEGPVGKEGKTGSEGKTGPEGKEGKTGKEGPTGPAGSPWTAGGTLPPGETETGTWGTTLGSNGEGYAAITFPIPLAVIELVGSQVHYVTTEEVNGHTAPASCPGTNEEPRATAGNLCVYQGVSTGAITALHVNYACCAGSGADNAGSLALVEGAAGVIAGGTFAVTEPTS